MALTLAEEHLQNLLPQTALDLLAPQFRKARNYLDGLDKNQLANWSKRVRAVPNGKSLLPATIASASLGQGIGGVAGASSTESDVSVA